MAARKKARRKSTRRADARPQRTFCAVAAEGLHELRVGSRVVVDVIVTADGEVLAFLRVDGAILGALPVLGQA